ncbi:MAG: transcriptional repressor [Dehalococcoidia bacterium]|nr:transcriptional repressor [Dehalococcoidia bacterium]
MEVTPCIPLTLRGKCRNSEFEMSCHEILRENGHRLTPQRMLVIEALHNADRHISAEELYKQLHSRYPYANISTVYRTLDLLKELNLVTEADFGEGRVRYHVAEKGHHHHLVCRSCSKVIDLEDVALSPLKDTLLQKYGFDADLKHLAISGKCSECGKKRRRKT